MKSMNDELQRIFFNTTSSCNLKCYYCYASARRRIDRDMLSLNDVKNLAEAGRRCGTKSVVLSGGEPLIRKDWVEIFSIFDDYDYQLAVSTNACLINKNSICKFSSFKDIIFQVSLDGDEQTMDKISGVLGTFKRVTRAIDLLISNGFEVQINTVVHNENYHCLPFLIKYSFERKIALRLTILNTDYGLARNKSHILSLEKLIRIIKAIHIARTANPYIELNIPPLLLHHDDWFPISPSCGWVHHQCGVLSNGDVTICGLATDFNELIAGNLRKQPLDFIWDNSELFKKLRSYTKEDLKGVCRICPFIDACGGSCRLTPYAKNRDFC
ncbi:MAG: radical SAM protein, partial [candidate division Zixibacteria bacterium]|nr:radical SAM protein [candidate division Zixibacteria bacterium]